MRGVRSALCLSLIAFLAVPFGASDGFVTTAEAGAATIQPGDFSTAGNSGCTLSWVYDGVGALAGRTYIGTAAHCVSHVGQSVSTTGNPGFGEVAFIGNACCTASDYAFVEVLPEFVDLVDPGVRGHPAWPTGTATADETMIGDPLFYSGYGTGFSFSALTRENRAGVLVSGGHTTYNAYGSALWGDSGGPLTHVSGEALGIVSRINLVTGMQLGPTVEGILAAAAADGFTVELRVAS